MPTIAPYPNQPSRGSTIHPRLSPNPRIHTSTHPPTTHTHTHKDTLTYERTPLETPGMNGFFLGGGEMNSEGPTGLCLLWFPAALNCDPLMESKGNNTELKSRQGSHPESHMHINTLTHTHHHTYSTDLLSRLNHHTQSQIQRSTQSHPPIEPVRCTY